MAVYRTCKKCRNSKAKNEFSSNQWSKGVGISRCKSCIFGGGGGHKESQQSTARINRASSATYTDYALENPFAEGEFRWVAKGKYTSGQRRGERCVTKWFKTGHIFDEEFFSKDIEAVDKAMDIIDSWNACGFIQSHIFLNKPEVWTFRSGCRWSGRKTLVEPYIANWEKFNSNSGWNKTKQSWSRVMQALSHFSYHSSSGQFVLCDLQGGIYRNGIVLTDPVILSRNKRYGVTDLGPDGISTFFARHTCNEYCRQSWTKPSQPEIYFPRKCGTSMMSTQKHFVTTRKSRPQLSTIQDYSYYDSDSDSSDDYW